MRRVTTSKVTKPKSARAGVAEGRNQPRCRPTCAGYRSACRPGPRSTSRWRVYRRPWICSISCKGKVVVSGMGKSGLIGQKIAATMASTGTPSFFLHPAEGLHGDLGMLARQRCAHCDFEQRRDAGNFAALALHGAHGYSCRGDRRPHEFDVGQEQHGRVGCVRRRRGLPHGTRADGEHDRDTRNGRCLGRRAAGEARVQGTGFCAIPSRWDARTPACW